MTPEHKEQLKKLLRVHEGECLKPYPDSVGIMTIGIGHNMQAKPIPLYMARSIADTGYITQEMEDELFDQDLEDATLDCYLLYPSFGSFPEHIQIALIDIMFNLGYHKLKSEFKNTVAHINAEQWDDVEEHLQKSAWYKQVHQRSKDDLALMEEGEKGA